MRSLLALKQLKRASSATIETIERRTLMSAGSLDPAFGTDGQTVLQGVALPGAAQTDNLAIDSQGRTLVSVSDEPGKQVNSSLVRLNANGSIDTSFNASAALSSGTPIDQILPELNGDILLVGPVGIERLTSTGALDQSFSSPGNGTSAVLLSNGKFLAIDGSSNIYRYNPNGSLDTAFGSGGSVSLTDMDVQDIKLDSTGRVVLSITHQMPDFGFEFGTARLLPTGQLDTTYGSGGIALDSANAAAPGTFAPHQSQIVIAANGTIDQLGNYYFKGQYLVQQDFTAYSSDGKQVAGATYSSVNDLDGRAFSVSDLAVQSNGDLIADGTIFNSNESAGTTFIARFEPLSLSVPGLIFDPSFNGSGEADFSAGNFSSGDSLALDSQGRLEAAIGTGTLLGTNLSVARILTTGTVASPPQLTGSVIGTAGSYKNDGNTIAKAFDGNLATFFDAPGPDNNWAGLDFGTAHDISQISFAPRSGFANRMVGGVFQGSNSADFSGYVETLYAITAAPPVGSLTTVTIGNTGPFRYVRYLSPRGGYGNIAEAKFFAAPQLLTGSIIGTSGSYESQGNTIGNVFDDDLNSFFDAPTASSSWVGMDFGSAKAVTEISYAPRAGFAQRMVGGMIQASNSANFSSGVVTAYTITAAPAVGALTTVQIAPIGAYRYWRYIGPTGSYCNISDLEFDGI